MLANCLNFSNLMNKANGYWNSNVKEKPELKLPEKIENEVNLKQNVNMEIDTDMKPERHQSNDCTNFNQRNTMCSSDLMISNEILENTMNAPENNELSIITETSDLYKKPQEIKFGKEFPSSSLMSEAELQFRVSSSLDGKTQQIHKESNNILSMQNNNIDDNTFISSINNNYNNNNNSMLFPESNMVEYGIDNHFGFCNQGFLDENIFNDGNALANNLNFIEKDNQESEMKDLYILNNNDFTTPCFKQKNLIEKEENTNFFYNEQVDEKPKLLPHAQSFTNLNSQQNNCGKAINNKKSAKLNGRLSVAISNPASKGNPIFSITKPAQKQVQETTLKENIISCKNPEILSYDYENKNNDSKNININININQSLNLNLENTNSKYSKKSTKTKHSSVLRNVGNEIKKLKASSLEKLVQHYNYNFEAISKLFSDCTAKEIEILYKERVDFKKNNETNSKQTISNKLPANIINIGIGEKKSKDKLSSIFYKEIMSSLFDNQYNLNNQSNGNNVSKYTSLKNSGVSNSMIRALAAKQEKRNSKENILRTFTQSVITTNGSSEAISKYLSSSYVTNTNTGNSNLLSQTENSCIFTGNQGVSSRENTVTDEFIPNKNNYFDNISENFSNKVAINDCEEEKNKVVDNKMQDDYLLDYNQTPQLIKEKVDEKVNENKQVFNTNSNFNELFNEVNNLSSNLISNFNHNHQNEDLTFDNIFNPNDYNKNEFNLEGDEQNTLMKINDLINQQNSNQTTNDKKDERKSTQDTYNIDTNTLDPSCFNLASYLNTVNKQHSISTNYNVNDITSKKYSLMEILRIQKLNSFMNCSFEKIVSMLDIYDGKYENTITCLENRDLDKIVNKTKETQDNIVSLTKSLKMKFSKYEHLIYLSLHKIIEKSMMNEEKDLTHEINTIDSVSFILPSKTHSSGQKNNQITDSQKNSDESSFNVISISLSKKIEALSHVIQLLKLKITWFEKVKDIEDSI